MHQRLAMGRWAAGGRPVELERYVAKIWFVLIPKLELGNQD